MDSEHDSLATELGAATIDGARAGRAWPLLALKEALAMQPRDAAFSRFAAVLGREPGASLASLRIESQRAAAERRPDFLELSPAGAAFSNLPPRVLGEGDHREIHHVERSQYVASFEDVLLRGRSQLVEAGDCVLLDFEGEELARIDDQLELDVAVFRREASQAWLLREPALPELRFERAFSLMGPNSFAFGHWIVEYLPRLWLALESGRLPPMTLLVDEGMPRQHVQALRMLAPAGFDIVEVAALQPVRVGRLWVAPSYYYAPLYPKLNERFRYEYIAGSPRLFTRLCAGMRDRLAAMVDDGPGQARLFLARRPSAHRKLVNRDQIEALAMSRGFQPVWLEDLDFAEQLRRVRSASHLLGPEGSAFFLAFFARPGTRVCFLNHPHTALLTTVTALLEPLGIDVSVFTGPFERIEGDGYLHFSDYRIEAAELAGFLDHWAPA